MLNIHIQRSDYRGGFEFFIESEQQGNCFLAHPIIMTKVEQLDTYQQPTFTVNRKEADQFFQKLIDTLWSMGIRPTGAKATDEQIAAINRHLQDMRRLVFYGPRLRDKPDGR